MKKLPNIDIRKIKLKKIKKDQRFSLTVLFGVFVFAVLLIALAMASAVLWLLAETGFFGGDMDELSLGWVISFMGISSLIIGAGMSLLLGMVPLKPINTFINHMNLLASGNFKTRLKFGGAISHHPTFNEISDSFNKLAEELENIEILRSDFINDFSHEFKTPIVSIAGLAKLVNKGNLTDEQRSEYLTAIEEESLRLASMATNVLKLTKVEKQNILSDVTEFNVSEQIRSCILLLENKWTQKNIELALDFDEYTVFGEEELLKEVWINLFDNAIKFSPYGGTVSADIKDTIDGVLVSVSNTGSGISEENMNKIWNKFYQADESHTSEGSGIGLAIVKRIVDLHGGEVSVKCENGKVTFSVCLPENYL